MKNIRLILLLGVLIGPSVAIAQQPIKDLRPTVILISLDGFRADYFEKHQPPTLTQLANEGVRARWMIPAFPTKTFPNHYTVATGLYPAHNGIVENSVWDFGVLFTMGKREEVQNGRWWLGEPIWVTAEKQGQRTAAMFFPGTEAEIAGKRPTFWKPYEHTYPVEKRVDQVLEWLDLSRDQRPTVYTMYFHDVDSAGHDSSPESEQTRQAVLKVDGAIERLVDGLRKRQIYGKVNLIIVSDHGMASVDVKRTDVLDDYIATGLTDRIVFAEAFVQVFPKPGKADETMTGLKNLRYGKCWKKEHIPDRFHYKDGPRVAPIICLADEGAVITSRQRYEDAKKRADYGEPSSTHGYDNALESMRAIFVGHGKAFKKRKLVEPFPNVDVYEIMCKILKLKPAKNDGDLKRVKGTLK